MDESKLIARILDGHTDDYGYFIERYGDSVASLVARLVPCHEDAEELVQMLSSAVSITSAVFLAMPRFTRG